MFLDEFRVMVLTVQQDNIALRSGRYYQNFPQDPREARAALVGQPPQLPLLRFPVSFTLNHTGSCQIHGTV